MLCVRFCSWPAGFSFAIVPRLGRTTRRPNRWRQSQVAANPLDRAASPCSCRLHVTGRAHVGGLPRVLPGLSLPGGKHAVSCTADLSVGCISRSCSRTPRWPLSASSRLSWSPLFEPVAAISPGSANRASNIPDLALCVGDRGHHLSASLSPSVDGKSLPAGSARLISAAS